MTKLSGILERSSPLSPMAESTIMEARKILSWISGSNAEKKSSYSREVIRSEHTKGNETASEDTSMKRNPPSRRSAKKSMKNFQSHQKKYNTFI